MEWLLIANTDKKNYMAKTIVDNDKLLYRSISKWLIRGKASDILNAFWEHVDQYDNELEDALLDQLITQAVDLSEDPQITNVRTKDYSIDMTVKHVNSNDFFKKCSVEFVLYVYFHSLKKKISIDTQNVNLCWININDKIETITVNCPSKTPSHLMKKSKRVSKRSSKIL